MDFWSSSFDFEFLSLDRSIARSIARSLARSLDSSRDRSIARSLGLSIAVSELLKYNQEYAWAAPRQRGVRCLRRMDLISIFLVNSDGSSGLHRFFQAGLV